METILISLIMSVSIIVSYTLGLKNGQKVVKGEEVQVPNPIRATKKFVEEIKEDKELEEIATILRNIYKYNGTGLGQEEVR